jgi:hypothetical protein
MQCQESDGGMVFLNEVSANRPTSVSNLQGFIATAPSGAACSLETNESYVQIEDPSSVPGSVNALAERPADGAGARGIGVRKKAKRSGSSTEFLADKPLFAGVADECRITARRADGSAVL